MVAADSSTQATLGTVSSPIELAPQGEHTSVSISGGKRKTVRPNVKVTLTSLTPNNVSPDSTSERRRRACSMTAMLGSGTDGRVQGLIARLARSASSTRSSCLLCTRKSSTRRYWTLLWTISTSLVRILLAERMLDPCSATFAALTTDRYAPKLTGSLLCRHTSREHLLPIRQPHLYIRRQTANTGHPDPCVGLLLLPSHAITIP
jgi:hypothetical protein